MRSCPNSTGTGQDVSDLNSDFPYLTGDVSSGYKGLEIKKLTVRNQKNKSKNTGCHSQNQGNGQRSPDNQEKKHKLRHRTSPQKTPAIRSSVIGTGQTEATPHYSRSYCQKSISGAGNSPNQNSPQPKTASVRNRLYGDKTQLYRNRNGTGSKSAPKSGYYHRLLF